MDGRIPRGRQRRWAWIVEGEREGGGEERGTIPGGDFSPGTRENLLKPFLRKSILYARSIFAIAKSPILLRIERWALTAFQSRSFHGSRSCTTTTTTTTPRSRAMTDSWTSLRPSPLPLPLFLLRPSLREISSLCRLNCSFPVQKRSQPPYCETPSIPKFHRERERSIQIGEKYKYRRYRN